MLIKIISKYKKFSRETYQIKNKINKKVLLHKKYQTNTHFYHTVQTSLNEKSLNFQNPLENYHQLLTKTQTHFCHFLPVLLLATNTSINSQN